MYNLLRVRIEYIRDLSIRVYNISESENDFFTEEIISDSKSFLTADTSSFEYTFSSTKKFSKLITGSFLTSDPSPPWEHILCLMPLVTSHSEGEALNKYRSRV